MPDNHERSWVKAISYRLLGVAWLSIISFLITGSIKETALINVVYHLLRIADYFFHERAWERITWGKK